MIDSKLMFWTWDTLCSNKMDDCVQYNGLCAQNKFAIFILAISAHLVRLSNISTGDQILDVACGTGNATVTARRMVPNIKVTGIDSIPELLAQAKKNKQF